MKGRRVRLSVSIDRVHEGGLIGTASAQIEVGGILFVVRGFEIRRELSGRLRIDVPAVAVAGIITPVIEIPQELENAIACEITELLR